MFGVRLIGQLTLQVVNRSRGGLRLIAAQNSVGMSRGLHSNTLKMCEQSQHSAKDSIVWVDMEMSGLDIFKDEILEISVIITDSNLNTISEGPDIVIHQSEHILNGMDEWCTKEHSKTGLTDAVRRSKVSIHEAEKQVLEFIQLHTPPGTCPLAGNSVYMDRLFLRKFMPLVDSHLHYRIIDVSSIKELSRRWCPEKFSKRPKKAFGHRALMDIKESIEELQYYKSVIFCNATAKV